MKRIILFRHGKSGWNESVSDQFRSVIEKGIDRTKITAHKLQELLDTESLQVFSSIATRAKQTAEIAKTIAFPHSDIQYEKELYTFSHLVLKNWIKSLDNSIDSVLIFGHNPAFTDIAYDLGSTFILNVPTSGVVWIEFDTNQWNQIQKGITKHTIFPKEL